MKKGIISSIVVAIFLLSFFMLEQSRQSTIQKNLKMQEEIKEVHRKKQYYKNYHPQMITVKSTALYKKENHQFKQISNVGEKMLLSLEPDDTILDYYQLKGTTYYIPAKDVKMEPDKKRENFLNYGSFGTVVLPKGTKLHYNNSFLELPEEMTVNVVVKLNHQYGVVFDEKLMFVENNNIPIKEESIKSATEMAVLNYHFFYDPEKGESCKEPICITTNQFKEQLTYLKENHYYAPTMQEFEWFLDGSVRLPKKSVLITIDDGAFGVASHAIPMLEEFKLQATLFLITGWFDYRNYQSDYVELHSHSNKMHTTKVCPGGQGGGIKCLPKEFIQNDLKTTRDLLNNTTSFAYPFYEYNDYAIQNLKEAGFRMAFRGGGIRAKVGSDKFLIPRYGIDKNTTIATLKQMLGAV